MYRFALFILLTACNANGAEGFYFLWEPDTSLTEGEFTYDLGNAEGSAAEYQIAWTTADEALSFLEISVRDVPPNGTFTLEGYAMSGGQVVTPCPAAENDTLMIEYNGKPAEMTIVSESSSSLGPISCFVAYSYGK